MLIPGDPIELYQPAPIFAAQAVLKADSINENELNVFKCPLYKTFLRTGRMSTNGQSDNFITFISIPLRGPNQNPMAWRFVGTALILQIDSEEI